LQQATGNFYTNLAMVAGGIPTYRTTTWTIPKKQTQPSVVL
jgi:hypothetical protein